jgi:hypothetical protein
MNKDEAQKRADRIRAFRMEIAEAERDKAITLSADQRAQLMAYHDRLLRNLAGEFDVL